MEFSRKKTIAYLTQIYGEITNRKFKLMSSKAVIGRSVHAEIRLVNPNISRSHCVLRCSENGWTITDNKSQNGTYISGRKLKPFETRLLQCGDIIFLGPPSEMPEAFCFDDALIDEDDSILESGHEIIEVPPAKRPAEEQITNSKKKILGRESLDIECIAEVSVAANEGLIKETQVTLQSRDTCETSKNDERSNKQEIIPLKNVNSVAIELKKASTESHISYPLSIDSSSTKQSELNKFDSGYQIHEISSTGDDQASNSLSLLEIEDKEIVEPSCSSMDVVQEKQIPENLKNAETLKEIDLLKSKLEFMTEQMKRIQESKLDLLKNYEVVCEKNFVLDQQLEEKKKIAEDLKSSEQLVQEKIKTELLEKFEEDLICNICTELLIKPTVLDCSHTFCLFCIKEWKKKKNECPICRNKIQTMTPVLTLEHFIDKTLSTLTPEQKEKRNQLIRERENQPKKVPTPRRQKHGRRRYRTVTNRNLIRPNAGENDVQYVGERSNILPMPLTIPRMFFSNIRIPDVLLDSGDTLNVYLA